MIVYIEDIWTTRALGNMMRFHPVKIENRGGGKYGDVVVAWEVPDELIKERGLDPISEEEAIGIRAERFQRKYGL